MEPRFPSLSLSDPAAQTIIEHRLPIVRNHVTRWYETYISYNQSTQHNEHQATPEQWIVDLERHVTAVGSQNKSAIQNGLVTWLEQYTLPLAADLGLISIAESQLLYTCFKRGFFDSADDTAGSLVHPKPDDVFPRVRRIFSESPYTTRRIASLLREHICRDEHVAAHVVAEINHCNRRAGGLARGIALSYQAYGTTGLLKDSDYPFTEELFLLVRQADHIATLSSDTHRVLEQLANDLLASLRAFQRARPKLWQQRLLHEPPDSPFRKAYKHRLSPFLHQRLLVLIAEERSCDEATAQHLLDTLLTRGLTSLIDWRCQGQDGQINESLERLRVQKILQVYLTSFGTEDRQTIEVLVKYIQDAMIETGVRIPLMTMITNQPSDAQRKYIGRRIWFSLTATMQRRQRRKKRSLEQVRFKRPIYRATKHTKHQPIDTLVTAFARHSGLEEVEARNRLRTFITYGLLGLLHRNRWSDCLDSRITSWLRLIKWGRFNGRIPWATLLHQVNRYAQDLGLAQTLTLQLVKGVFYNLPMPRYWRGGQGEATAIIPQRSTLATSHRPRLHATWIIVPLTIPISMCDTGGETLSIESHILLVFDEASGILMGAWPSPHQPSEKEVCLAIYQSIWHPGSEPWPIHGIPEMIKIPEALATSGLSSLRQAVEYLLAEIEVSPQPWRGLRQIIDLIQAFKENPPHAVLPSKERCQGKVLSAILTWFRLTQLKYHRGAPVWVSVRRHGVDMPGHDTPAAGWLLPLSNDIEILL